MDTLENKLKFDAEEEKKKEEPKKEDKPKEESKKEEKNGSYKKIKTDRSHAGYGKRKSCESG